MPDEWASIRSMARCVLPVLVGPRTAVTPAPRARASDDGFWENESGITRPDCGQGLFAGPAKGLLYHNATVWGRAVEYRGLRVKLWNESGTKRARIADSRFVQIRSRLHLDRVPSCPTRSGRQTGFHYQIRRESLNGRQKRCAKQSQAHSVTLKRRATRPLETR